MPCQISGDADEGNGAPPAAAAPDAAAAQTLRRDPSAMKLTRQATSIQLSQEARASRDALVSKSPKDKGASFHQKAYLAAIADRCRGG